MLSYVKARSKIFFQEGHERSLKVKKNVIITFLVKGASVPVSLLMVPMTINYINPVQYGVWLTISSVIGWMNFFDIGLGQGLKNKIAHSLAVNEHEQINKYVSTVYAILAIISFAFFIVFYLLSSFFNWNELLNIPASVSFDIRPVIIAVVICFCVQFVAQTVGTILIATHQPFKASLMTFIGQVGNLIIIYVLTRTVPANLMLLVLVLAGFPILVLIAGSVYLFKTEFKQYAPKFRHIEMKYARGLLGTGGIFFFIQIAVLVLVQTDNIIITRILGPTAVTDFNVAYKLFSIIIMLFTIIISPYWSAFTDAYAKKDFQWIKTSMQKMRQMWLLLAAMSVLFAFISKPVYKIWLGDVVSVPISLSFAMAFYVMIYSWQALHIYLLNGVGKLRLQLILVVISALVNVPIAVFLGRRFGLAGIISANTIVFLIMGVVFYIQCQKIVNQNATGIWNK